MVPSFVLKMGSILTRSRLVMEVGKALLDEGLQPETYAGHSFRIGAGTTAVAYRVPADVTKTLGQWRSQAYLLYVRLPSSQLSDISRKLVSTDI